MRIGVAIDTWKLDIFARHLAAAGYTYANAPGVTADTQLLMVEASPHDTTLVEIVQKANDEAAKQGRPT